MSTRTIASTLLLLSACTDVENLGEVATVEHSVFGEQRWAISLGGAADDRAWAVATDPAGDVIAGGEFGATVDFGNGTVTAANSGGWISKRSAADGHALWTATFGTESTARGSVGDVAVDTNGNIIVLGNYSGTMQLGAETLTSGGLTSSSAGFLAKFTTDGSLLWARDLGAGGGTSLALSLDGRIAIAGGFLGTLRFPNGTFSGSGSYVALLDANGDAQWGVVGSEETWIASVELTPENDVLLTGSMGKHSTFAEHELTAIAVSTQFAARMTASGVKLWVRVIGSAGERRNAAGVFDGPGGTTYIAASLETINANGKASIDAIDPNGHNLWSRKLGSGARAHFATASATGAIITGGNVLEAPATGDYYNIDFGLGKRNGIMFLVAHDTSGALVDHTTVLEGCTGLFYNAAPSAANGLAMVGSQQDKVGGLDTCLRDAGKEDALIMMLDMK